MGWFRFACRMARYLTVASLFRCGVRPRVLLAVPNFNTADEQTVDDAHLARFVEYDDRSPLRIDGQEFRMRNVKYIAVREVKSERLERLSFLN